MNKKLRVAIIGSRGYPYVYSGYETFVKETFELLSDKHDIHVYCHRYLFEDKPFEVNDIILHYIPKIKHKALGQLSNSLLSTLHALLFHRFDAILYVNTANFSFGLLTKNFGVKSATITDGLEWLRPKWEAIGSKCFLWASKFATKVFDVLIADSVEMRRIYSKKFAAALFQNSCPFYFKGKSVLFVHDIIFKSHPQYFTFIEKMIFKSILISFWFCDSVITISENEKNRIVKYNYKDSADIHVVNNGADHLISYSDDISNSEEVSQPNYILYVGRINDRKNIKNLVKAMDSVESDIQLFVAGGGDWKNSLVSYNKSKVQFLGYVSETRVKELYLNAKAFVFVSYEEGFGLPPLEAMSYNLPVIVSNVSCFPEDCGDAPLYVNSDDTKDIAKKIDMVCKDESLRNSMIEKGKQRVSQYTWDRHVKEMLSVLNR